MRELLLMASLLFQIAASAASVQVNVHSEALQKSDDDDLIYELTFSGNGDWYDDKPIYGYDDIKKAASHSNLNAALAAVDASYDLTVDGNVGWKDITELKIVGQINYPDVIVLHWLMNHNPLSWSYGAGGTTGGNLKKLDISETTFAIESIEYINIFYGSNNKGNWPKERVGYGGYDDFAKKQMDTIYDIPSGAFTHVRSLEEVILNPKATIIGDDSFDNTTSLKSITFPEGTTSDVIYISWAAAHHSAIEYFAFEQCPKLETIGYEAFYHCDNLLTIDCSQCPELKEIRGWAFAYTLGLGKADFSNCTKLEAIRACAFFISGLSDVDFTNCTGLTVVGSLAICGTQLTTLDISPCSSLATLDMMAMGGNDNLTYIDASGCVSLTSIDHGAFTNFAMEQFDFPESLSDGIELNCLGSIFYRCFELKSISFPEGTKDVGYAMEGCESLETVCLPSTVENVGGASFNQCPSLRTIYCKNASVPTCATGDRAGDPTWTDLFNTWGTALKDADDNTIAATKPEKIVVYVPEGALDNYKADANDNWNKCIVAEPKTVGWQYSTYCRAQNHVTTMVPDDEREAWSYPSTDYLKAYKITGYQAYTGDNAPNDVDYEAKAVLLDGDFEATNGVMLVTDNTSGDYYVYSRPESTKSVADISGNQLVGVTERTENIPQRAEGRVNFFLGDDAFYLVRKSGNYLAAGRAYLSLPESVMDKPSLSSKGLGLTFVDAQATGITSPSAASAPSASWYTLQGTRTASPSKGIYVRDGKKVIIK